MYKLDEKGFVFIDSTNKPFKICLISKSPWLFYWHNYNKTWVSLRPVNQTEIFQFSKHKISLEQQNLYDNYWEVKNELQKNNNIRL